MHQVCEDGTQIERSRDNFLCQSNLIQSLKYHSTFFQLECHYVTFRFNHLILVFGACLVPITYELFSEQVRHDRWSYE